MLLFLENVRMLRLRTMYIDGAEIRLGLAPPRACPFHPLQTESTTNPLKNSLESSPCRPLRTQFTL